MFVYVCVCVCVCVYVCVQYSPRVAWSLGAAILDHIVNCLWIDVDLACIHMWE